MVDRALLAKAIAAIRDAVERVRQILPRDLAAFLADRTVREVVVPRVAWRHKSARRAILSIRWRGRAAAG